MKRLAVLLALLLLIACQPTPEREFVVNKGDGTLEEKLNATPVPMEEPTPAEEPTAGAIGAPESEPTAQEAFPDRWDAEPVGITDGFTIAAHADVIAKADGLYPVYRVRDTALSEDWVESFVEALLGKPVACGEYAPTKAELGSELQLYLDEVAAWEQWVADGKPDDVDVNEAGYTPEEIEAVTADYMERIRQAPDELATTPTQSYAGLVPGQQMTYVLEDGSRARIVYYHGDGIKSTNEALYLSKTDGGGYVYPLSWHMSYVRDDEEENVVWKPVTLTREEAEQTLRSELMRLGLSDFTVKLAEEACFYEVAGTNHRYVSGGWVFTLHRNPGGYPESSVPCEPSQSLQYGVGEEFLANKPIQEEIIELYIDENGIEHCMLLGPKEITGVANPNVELLPFSEVQARAIGSLGMCYPYRQRFGRSGIELPLEIYQILLTTWPVRERNGDDILLMPCWFVFFDGDTEAMDRITGVFDEETIQRRREEARADLGMTHGVLVLNAVDGSIVHTDYGY